MIRAILFAAVGYWVSRKIYEAYDLKKRKEMLETIERRIAAILDEEGWSKKEIENAIDEILGENE